jgi:hypothetical protein
LCVGSDTHLEAAERALAEERSSMKKPIRNIGLTRTLLWVMVGTPQDGYTDKKLQY